ncbi:SRPBCC family protein [Nocardia sp. NPDC059239]|uniref:SRPBCC family protein n=1 Tax=unclassified Nocardia TaxID=2637762 RepID=UPI00368CD1DB
MTVDWPIANLDPVRRLRVLAAGIPGAVVTETFLDADPHQAWETLSDLERTVPQIQPHVRQFRIVGEEHGRMVADVRGYAGLRARMSIDMQPFLCCMQSRYLVVGMAVTPEGNGTRFARMQGLRFPRPFPAVLMPLADNTIRAEAKRVAHLPFPR